MKEKFLYIVLILCGFIVVSCGNHENVNQYEIKIISKNDTTKSHVAVIYNGKTTMPIRRTYHCYYLILQYKDVSVSKSEWSDKNIIDVSSTVYEKYKVGNIYTINGHTHIDPKNNKEYLCWHSF